MRKIAFLLALALALTSCLLVLAACSEDEADTSSEAGAASTETSSTAGTSSKTETSSTATSENTSSEEESSEEESIFEKNPDALPNEDGENLALGMPYTKSMLYRQGGADVQWAYDENADEAWPDTNDEELTDGVIAEEDEELANQYENEAWVGFHGKCPDAVELGYCYFTVDLQEIYELSKLVVYVGTTKVSGGVGAPNSVEFLVSEDGEEFVSVGKPAVSGDAENVTVPVELECDVTGRFVQVRLVRPDAWIFVTEFEAY